MCEVVLIAENDFRERRRVFSKNAEEQEFVRINGFESRWSDFSSDTGNLLWVASTTFDKGKEVKMIGRARTLLTSE